MNVPTILSHYFGDSAYNESFKTSCVYHSEHTPSLTVNANTGVFYCFGCGVTGTIVDLVAKIEDVNTLIALAICVKLSKGSNSFIPIQKQNKNWLNEAKVLFNSCIKPSWPNIKRHYLLKRGFTPKTLSYFDIRLDPFSDHPIVIPLRENKSFKGYLRRRSDSDDEPKYLYNPGFRRKIALVGEYRKGVILVAEGFLDMAKAWQGGFSNICCTLGWKPTSYQIEKLKKYTDTIISGLDNTETGEKGNAVLGEHFNIVRFPFPDGKKDIGAMSTYQVNYSRMLIEEELKNGKRVRSKHARHY
jgi:DNA primase